MKKFLVTTALGGILFLVPLVFIFVILGKAFQIMTLVARPLEKLLPIDSIAGVGVINIMAILIMLLACLAAGIIARSRAAQAFYQKVDGVLLELIPGYAWTKTVMSSFAGSTDVDEQFKPVLVTLDDQMQVAFELERTAEDLVVVFFPGAPDVRSGSVAYVTAERVTPVDSSFLAINKSMKHMGKGASKILPPSFKLPPVLVAADNAAVDD
jgi:uncharacterized membrane protein